MRIFLTRITSLCFAITLLTLSAVTAFADEEQGAGNSTELTINGDASANIGEVVTYTLYLAEASDPVVGFELRLFYDSDVLEYQQGSLHFDKFDVVIYNEGIPGKISYDLLSGDKKLVDGKNPPVNQSADVVDRYSGDFPNYDDGMGDNYVSGSRSEQHEVLVEENGSLVPYVRSSVREVATPAATADGAGWFQRNSWILFVGIGLAVAAVAVAVAVAVKKGKKEG